jgi:hypothetical protein
MRAKIVLGGLAGAGILAVLVTLLPKSTGQPVNNNGEKPADGALPIHQVVLFNSGIGYFQREGDVSGNARINLSFPADSVNDLLKSLILQDLGGGRINSVNYDSHDPIDKTLRSFALDLTTNPTFGQILNQARGEKIELGRLKDGKPEKITGVIIGMETQRRQIKDQFLDQEFLNLNGAKGLEKIPLVQVLGVKFLNPLLEREFQRALQLLASSHDTMKKTVSLGFDGQGKRHVRVGYVVEHPIWKTSYRLRLEPNGRAFLQGWALVENTSDDDWNNVRMVLVSGRPISYQMNLYEPLYIPRPFVEPELFASLRPPVYSGAMGEPTAPADKAQAQGQGVPGMPMVAGGRIGGGAFVPSPGNMPMGGMGMMGMMGGGGMMPPGWAGNVGGGLGIGNYALGNQQANPYQNLFGMNNTLNFSNTQNRLTYEQLQQRRQQRAQVREDAKKVGTSITGLNFKEGIASVASAEEIGDYFRYILDQQIKLPRKKSAMLPILDQTIEGTKVSIYNESVHAKYPLLGLRLKNTSGRPLTQGPITVYEDGSYAGDTRILDLQPNEERLLSYALDLGTEVKSESSTTPSPHMNFRIGGNTLASRYKLRQTKTYIIKNRSPHARTLIIEHPLRRDWKLINPMKPHEQSRDVYRFQVMVPAGKGTRFEVVEEQARADQVALTRPSPDRPIYATSVGVEVKQVVHTSPEKLTELKIKKGILFPRYQVRESTAYFVQNLSDQDRSFTVDHVIRKEWARLGKDGVEQRGPDVFRFKLEVARGKTGHQEVVEENIRLGQTPSLKDLADSRLREFLADPAPSAEVKAALTRVLDLAGKLEEARTRLADMEKQLKILTEDQSRLRENLKIIPQTSDLYKQFLQKFATQEGRFETLQRDIRQLQVNVQNQQKAYEAFLAKLNAE